MKILFSRRQAATVFMIALALFLIWILWWHYMLSPWTRDGRVRAYVVNVASQISGQVIEVKVADNEFVHKGDVLFIIDPGDYRLALDEAEATLASREEDMNLKNVESARRVKLGQQAISAEETQVSASTASVARAMYQQSVATRDRAKLDLERITVRSPVNGYVANLSLQAGDYSVTGQPHLSIVDSDSFWVSGYFEETKLPYIRINDHATIRLMGVKEEVEGHVESISRGISDPNGLSDTIGLPNVNPIFTWVRLAQRIPVRVHIDHIPDNVFLAAGQTCTVVIYSQTHSE